MNYLHLAGVRLGYTVAPHGLYFLIGKLPEVLCQIICCLTHSSGLLIPLQSPGDGIPIVSRYSNTLLVFAYIGHDFQLLVRRFCFATALPGITVFTTRQLA